MMGDWGSMYRYGGPGNLLGLIITILLLLFLVWAIVSFIRWIGRQDDPYYDRYPDDPSRRNGPLSGRGRRDSALDVLEERYARGELTREEFEDKKRDLRRR